MVRWTRPSPLLMLNTPLNRLEAVGGAAPPLPERGALLVGAGLPRPMPLNGLGLSVLCQGEIALELVGEVLDDRCNRIGSDLPESANRGEGHGLRQLVDYAQLVPRESALEDLPDHVH